MVYKLCIVGLSPAEHPECASDVRQTQRRLGVRASKNARTPLDTSTPTNHAVLIASAAVVGDLMTK